MLEILTDTDKRLVMRLDRHPLQSTKIILDKNAGRAWFDRQRRWLPQRSLALLLAEIASAATIATPTGQPAPDCLLLTTQSGRQYRFAGDRDDVNEAARRLRDFIDLAAHEPEQTLQPVSPLADWGRRALGLAPIVAGGVIALGATVLIGWLLYVGAGKVTGLAHRATEKASVLFTLPECNAPASVATIQELVRDRLGSSATLSEITQSGTGDGERLCSAVARGNTRTAKVNYRTSWDGQIAKVRLAGEIAVARLDDVRMATIVRVGDEFLAESRNAHLSGHPPRQSNPETERLLTTLFGVSDLAAETLPADEIDKALQWLKIGDRIGAVYVLAGTGYDDFAQVPPTEAIQRRMRANVVSYADEFGRYVDFQLTLLAVIANAQMRVAASDADVAGDETRVLLSQAMRGCFIALVYDGLSDTWRMNRLTTLGRVAPIAARFLSRDEAQAVREQALQTLDYFKDTAVRDRVREIADTIAAP
jgi:hypothetical protein